MPEYLAPGVYVEEVSYRHKSIEGVGTSVAAIVGPTRTGPVSGTPESLTSFAEFVRTYGGLQDLTFGGTAVPNYTAIAARAFFDNGGKNLFVVRVPGSTDAGGQNGPAPGTNAAPAAAGAQPDLSFASRFPGAASDYWLEVNWREDEIQIASEQLAEPDDGGVYLLEAEEVPLAAKDDDPGGGAIGDDKFPVNIRALVEFDSDDGSAAPKVRVVGPSADIVGNVGTPEVAPVGGNQIRRVVLAGLPGSARFTRVRLRQSQGRRLTDGAPAELRFRAAPDLDAFLDTGDVGIGSLWGTLNSAGDTFSAPADVNAELDRDTDIPLALLAAADVGDVEVHLLRSFDLDVREGDMNSQPVFTYTDVSTNPADDRGIGTVVAVDPPNRRRSLTEPVGCTVNANSAGDVVSALLRMRATPFPTNRTGFPRPDRHVIQLSNGSNGQAPTAAAYAGAEGGNGNSTGFVALEDVDEISIVMAPAAAADAGIHQAVVNAMEIHCSRMRYRVGVVDARAGMAPSEAREFASQFSSSRLALYYPWVVVPHPSTPRTTLAVPPAGFIAGVYASTDIDRGVHKPPANEVVRGALRFEQEINAFQQELLNPRGVNCLRSFPRRGHRVWGARTLSGDPEWKYVNVRRYFLYLEKSIELSTQWAVFEPNGEALWANVRSAVDDFLFNEWKNGRLLGATPEAAYFVTCDRSTMTQNEIDNGIMVCEIGVAALKPAEFVVFRIGQKTADA